MQKHITEADSHRSVIKEVDSLYHKYVQMKISADQAKERIRITVAQLVQSMEVRFVILDSYIRRIK